MAGQTSDTQLEPLTAANNRFLSQHLHDIHNLIQQATDPQARTIVFILTQVIRNHAHTLGQDFSIIATDSRKGASGNLPRLPFSHTTARVTESMSINDQHIEETVQTKSVNRTRQSRPKVSDLRKGKPPLPESQNQAQEHELSSGIVSPKATSEAKASTSLEITISHPIDIQRKVYDDLMKINVDLTRATKSGKRSMHFTDEEARAITRCIFHDIANIKGLERLNNLIDEYGKYGSDRKGIGVATRAMRISDSDDIPIEARPVFHAYGQLQRSLVGEGARLKAFRTLMERVDLVDAYQQLIRCVDDGEKAVGLYNEKLNRLFRQQGFTPSQGRSWSSVVIDWMANQLKVDRSAVQERIHQSAGIHEMVKAFGYGCLTIVPDNMAQLIMKWKIGKMEQVWPVIHKRFPLFQEMCVWLNEHVVQHVVEGSSCSIRKLDLDENNKPIFERLIEAQQVVQVPDVADQSLS